MSKTCQAFFGLGSDAEQLPGAPALWWGWVPHPGGGSQPGHPPARREGARGGARSVEQSQDPADCLPGCGNPKNGATVFRCILGGQGGPGGRTSLVHALPPSCMPAPPSCIDPAQRFHRRAQIKVYSTLERSVERFKFRLFLHFVLFRGKQKREKKHELTPPK
jgi:hypothetical protein